MDGLQGPMLSGTGFYMKRKALYGDIVQEGGWKKKPVKQNYSENSSYWT